MKVTRISRATLAITAVIGLAVGVISPSTAATRTTVVLIESNALTSLNPNTPDTNLTFNVDVAYMTGMGFNYYNNAPALDQLKMLQTSNKTTLYTNSFSRARNYVHYSACGIMNIISACGF